MSIEASSIVQVCIMAFVYATMILLVQAFFQEMVLPRLTYQKTSAQNLKQMVIRWIFYTQRFNFSVGRDGFSILTVGLMLTALAVLPLDGHSGLRVDRPDLAIALIMLSSYLTRIFSDWKSQDRTAWERSLEELLFASLRVLLFLLLINGAYLAASSKEFTGLMGEDFLFIKTPFHFLSLVTGILLVGYFYGRRRFRTELRGPSLFAWKLEPILWISLLLVTFTNAAAVPGPAYFFSLGLKAVLILCTLDLVRSHIPIFRMDQLERTGLKILVPLTFILFLAMWWKEVVL